MGGAMPDPSFLMYHLVTIREYSCHPRTDLVLGAVRLLSRVPQDLVED